MWEISGFIAVVLGCGCLVIWLRRKYHPKSYQAASGNLTLAQIENIHKSNLMSDEEFTALRKHVISLQAA